MTLDQPQVGHSASAATAVTAAGMSAKEKRQTSPAAADDEFVVVVGGGTVFIVCLFVCLIFYVERFGEIERCWLRKKPGSTKE